MRGISKFAASLLVLLMTVPALALTPCQSVTHSMKCCIHDCTLMANTARVKVPASRTGTVSGLVCCRPSSSSAVPPFIDQKTTDNRANHAALHAQLRSPVLAVAKSCGPVSSNDNRDLKRPSRTVLCSYLI